MKTRPIIPALLLLTAGLLGACTASQESAAEVDRAPVPTTVRTDADRQAAYNSGAGYGGSVPDATPSRVNLGEEASSINSRKRVGTLNTDDANTTTPQTRIERLNDAPTQPVRRP